MDEQKTLMMMQVLWSFSCRLSFGFLNLTSRRTSDRSGLWGLKVNTWLQTESHSSNKRSFVPSWWSPRHQISSRIKGSVSEVCPEMELFNRAYLARLLTEKSFRCLDERFQRCLTSGHHVSPWSPITLWSPWSWASFYKHHLSWDTETLRGNSHSAFWRTVCVEAADYRRV